MDFEKELNDQLANKHMTYIIETITFPSIQQCIDDLENYNYEFHDELTKNGINNTNIRIAKLEQIKSILEEI